MPDLDRTTLLKESFREMLERILMEVQDGEVSAGAAYDMLEAALPSASSEAPAEAFTAQFTAEQVDEQADYHVEVSMHYEPRTVAMLRELARLVRERHTGKVGKGQEVNVMRGELSGPNEVIVLSPLTIAQLRELDSLTPRQVQALCNSHEALRHTGKG